MNRMNLICAEWILKIIIVVNLSQIILSNLVNKCLKSKQISFDFKQREKQIKITDE